MTTNDVRQRIVGHFILTDWIKGVTAAFALVYRIPAPRLKSAREQRGAQNRSINWQRGRCGAVPPLRIPEPDAPAQASGNLLKF